MNTDPAPDTTLSAADAATTRYLGECDPMTGGMNVGVAYSAAHRIIRDLDAKLVAALRLAEQRNVEMEAALERARLLFESEREQVAKNAALTERLRVAEERLREWDDHKRALAHRGPSTVITMCDAAPEEAM